MSLFLPETKNINGYIEKQTKDQGLGGIERFTSEFEDLRQRLQATGQDTESSSFKLPSLPKKDLQNFIQSTFEKGGLSGPPTGVSVMAWSFDCRFLATKCDSLPQVVWVWDLQTVELHSFLVLLSPVKSLSWSPVTNHLLISSGQPRFFVWTQYQASIFETSPDGSQVGGVQLGISKVKWHPKGTKIILSDKTHAVIGLPSFDFMQLA